MGLCDGIAERDGRWRVYLNGRRWNDHVESAVFDTGGRRAVLEGSKPVVE